MDKELWLKNFLEEIDRSHVPRNWSKIVVESGSGRKATYRLDNSPRKGPSRQEYQKLLEDLKAWAADHGVRVACNRLQTYDQLMSTFNQKIGSGNFDPTKRDEDHKLADEFCYARREVDELLWIYNGFKDSPPKGLSEKLPLILGGTDFARDEKNSIARNHQFELRIGSYFSRAGYIVDLTRKTDVVAEKNGLMFNVECKRLKSHKKVTNRIEEALKQLEPVTVNRNALGIACFDVTGLAYPHQGMTWAFTDKQAKDNIQEKLREISRNFPFHDIQDTNPQILLVWLQIHIPAINLVTSQVLTRFSNLFLVKPESGFRMKAFRALQKVIERKHDRTEFL